MPDSLINRRRHNNYFHRSKKKALCCAKLAVLSGPTEKYAYNLGDNVLVGQATNHVVLHDEGVSEYI